MWRRRRRFFSGLSIIPPFLFHRSSPDSSSSTSSSSTVRYRTQTKMASLTSCFPPLSLFSSCLPLSLPRSFCSAETFSERGLFVENGSADRSERESKAPGSLQSNPTRSLVDSPETFDNLLLAQPKKETNLLVHLCSVHSGPSAARFCIFITGASVRGLVFRRLTNPR